MQPVVPAAAHRRLNTFYIRPVDLLSSTAGYVRPRIADPVPAPRRAQMADVLDLTEVITRWS